MNYPIFQFSKHLHFFQRFEVIVEFVPLMVQMAETHFHTRL